MSFNYLSFEDKLYKKAAMEGIPLAGELELTGRCNFSCSMCYVGRHKGEKKYSLGERSTGEWLKLIEEARNAGMLYMTLTGGEVLMRNDFMEIYNEASRMGLIIAVFTNGSLVTAEIARNLARIPPVTVEITLYGASSETYGKVCGNPGGYEKTRKGIELLLAEGINVSLKTTLIRDNAAEYDELFEFADAHGIGLKHVKYISPQRDEYCNLQYECRLSPEDQVKINSYASRKFDERLQKIRKLHGSVKVFPFDQHREFDETGSGHPFSCAAGRCSFWMTWDGRMTPCSLIGEPASRPFETGFAEAWKSLREYSRTVPVCEECKACPLKNNCLSCPARLKQETGYFDRPAPYLCGLATSLSKLYNKETNEQEVKE